MQSNADTDFVHDLTAHRASELEQQRASSLLSMVPAGTTTVLDVGTRDGHLARQLADLGCQVTALDLRKPQIHHPGVTCVQGNATSLDFPDRHFDLVLCAEVLEHIPSPGLERACQELVRVSRAHLLIGVPFDQDIRVGRTTCRACGGISPPWGHVNSFDERRLVQLFSAVRQGRTEFVGQADARTTALATWLMDRAGNPWGTYGQEEACVHCGQSLPLPADRSLLQRVLSRLAVLARDLGTRGDPPRPNWIHILFDKR